MATPHDQKPKPISRLALVSMLDTRRRRKRRLAPDPSLYGPNVLGDTWTLGTGWVYQNGVLSCDGSQTANSLCSQTGVLEVGATYRMLINVQCTAGLFRLFVGSLTSVGWFGPGEDGQLNFELTQSGGAHVYVQGNASFVGSASLTVQKIPG